MGVRTLIVRSYCLLLTCLSSPVLHRIELQLNTIYLSVASTQQTIADLGVVSLVPLLCTCC